MKAKEVRLAGARLEKEILTLLGIFKILDFIERELVRRKRHRCKHNYVQHEMFGYLIQKCSECDKVYEWGIRKKPIIENDLSLKVYGTTDLGGDVGRIPIYSTKEMDDKGIPYCKLYDPKEFELEFGFGPGKKTKTIKK